MYCRSVLFHLLILPCLAPYGVTAGDAVSWELVWSDEFNYTGLPDPAKWDYEEGFIRNQELQYYTRARPENARVEGGVLIIEGRKERFPNAAYKPGDKLWKHSREYADYTSACLITLGRATWTYGRMEASIQVPHDGGSWPAFWTLGVNRSEVGWPTCGEIDILEYLAGGRPKRVESNVHYGIGGKHRHRQGVVNLEGSPAGFHIYAMEWSAERIDFFFDQRKYWSFPVTDADDGDANAYRQAQYLLLNLALDSKTPAGPMDDTRFPRRMLVDYVRIYRQGKAVPCRP